MSARTKLLPVAQVPYRLRAIREARKMSQGEVAHRAGLAMQQVSQIELGKRGLALGEFAGLCLALDVDPRDVLTDEPLPVEWV